MASTFQSGFGLHAADGLMRDFADAVRITYTPKATGTGVKVRAVIGDEYPEFLLDSSGNENKETVIDCKITRDPTSPYGGVATLKANDDVTISGETWAVYGWKSTATFHSMVLRRIKATDRTRPTR